MNKEMKRVIKAVKAGIKKTSTDGSTWSDMHAFAKAAKELVDMLEAIDWRE